MDKWTTKAVVNAIEMNRQTSYAVIDEGGEDDGDDNIYFIIYTLFNVILYLIDKLMLLFYK